MLALHDGEVQEYAKLNFGRELTEDELQEFVNKIHLDDQIRNYHSAMIFFGIQKTLEENGSVPRPSFKDILDEDPIIQCP